MSLFRSRALKHRPGIVLLAVAPRDCSNLNEFLSAGEPVENQKLPKKMLASPIVSINETLVMYSFDR